MKKIAIVLCICVFSLTGLYGQGTVRGKITDENGEAIIGATVVLKSNRGIGSITDLDGNYSVKIPDSTAQVLIVSFLSYSTLEIPVQVSKGAVLAKNSGLKPASQAINQVEIVAKAVKARDYYVEKMKINSVTTIDYVSSETMKKTGDANVTTAVARVSGVSTSGGFITVRGIGDRYVKTAINGSVIPTLDPFTNNIKLDIFPSSLVDNIIITKTASPDLPGDWAGAYLSVETKDYPEELSVNLESSFGYNSQATFKEVLSSQHSSTDWLGYDNSFRDYNHADFTDAIFAPTPYQEFVALGLGPYFNSIGVNGQNWGEGTTQGDLYYKLALIQLGLLAPGQINDVSAVATAKNNYINGSYQSDAFKILNAEVPASGKAFPNNWQPTMRKAPLNFSQSLSVGNQFTVFGKQVGFLAGIRYGSSVQYDAHANENRADVSGDGFGNLIPVVSSAILEKITKETNGWSALLNLAVKLNANNSVSLLFMPNLAGVNQIRSAVDNRDSTDFKLTKSQVYEQRKQLVYQFKSEHYIPVFKLKLDLSASYTNGKSSLPDFKNLSYKYSPKSNTYQIGSTTAEGIHRYFRYLSDNLFDSRISFEFPIGSKPGLTRKVKFGGAYQANQKRSDQYDYSLNLGPQVPALTNDDIEGLFSLNNFDIYSYNDNSGLNHTTLKEYYTDNSTLADHTFGNSQLTAGYLMLDYSIVPSLRISGGLRIEKAHIFTDVVEFDALGLSENDPRRTYNSGLPNANPGKLDKISYLPGVNIIYKVKNDEDRPINLRFNFNQTVARPSIRELSDVATFDYEFRSFVYGNSNLQLVRINNYDVRGESYFKSGDNLSASVFYKDFRNHIELVKSGGYSWQNVDKSYVAGIELEGKKKLSKNFELIANLTLATSETKFVRTRLEIADGIKTYIPVDTIKRAMFGQAPYVINGIFIYKADSIGLNLALSYNLQGPRLVVASDKKEVPDIYELPRHLLDLKISKKLGKHFNISLTIRDLLNAPVVRAYKGRNLDYDNFSYGTNYLLGFSYKL